MARITEEELFEALDHGIALMEEWHGELDDVLRVLGIDRVALKTVLEERWAAARETFADVPLTEGHKKRLFAAGMGEGLLMGVPLGRRGV